MKRTIVLDCTREHYSGYQVLAVLVTSASLIEWCLDLVMLYVDVVQVLSIIDTSGKEIMQVVLDERIDSRVSGLARIDDHVIKVTYRRGDILGWLNFYLIYYRDGFVGADHFDVDLPLTNDQYSPRLGIIFKAADVGPPLTLEEANRLLDD